MFKKLKDERLLRNFDNFSGIMAYNNASLSASKSMIIGRNNSVYEGKIAYGLWLNAEDKKAPTLPILMKEFKEDKKVVLQDNTLQKGVIVDIVEGIPFCNQCRSNDCAHVGFAICAEQMKET